MQDIVPDDQFLRAEIVRPDTRLRDAVQILGKIENGQGAPEDLVRYVELAHGYYRDQLEDPTKAQDPNYQEAARHHQIASEGGPVGLMGFCVAQMQRQLTEAAEMHQGDAPNTRDRYLTKARNWAGLMSQIDPQNLPRTTTVSDR